MAKQNLTTIHSNGSGSILPLEALFDRLATETLDPTFEDYGNFVEVDPLNEAGKPLLAKGGVSFFGNFATYSHVFNIDTTDKKLIKRLTAAIRANQARPEYAKAKAEQAQAEAARSVVQVERERVRQEETERRARIVLGQAA